MDRRNKSALLIAHAICWGGAILCALILIYGPHGPARQPKMMMISLLPVAIISVSTLKVKGADRMVVVVHGVLWVIAAVSALLLVHTSVGESVPPIAMPIILAFLSAILLGVLYTCKIDDAIPEPSPEE